jgi:GTP-binding protein
MSLDNVEDSPNNCKIIDASFVLSAVTKADYQNFLLPEVVFVGRSNVGKSSIINAVCERRGLARTSKTPGRTQAINFFLVKMQSLTKAAQESVGIDKVSNAAEQHKKEFHLADLPGYGFSKVGRKTKIQWELLLEEYLVSRKNIRGLILLLDSRRDITEDDMWFATLGVPNLMVVLSKCDKLSKNELSKKIQSTKVIFKNHKVDILATSVLSKQGIQDLRNKMFSWLA